MSVYDDGAHQATIARNDDNSFVRADEPNAALAEASDGPVEEAPIKGGLPRVYDALYATALEQEVPPPLMRATTSKRPSTSTSFSGEFTSCW